jgi:hypothetical protein
MAIKTSTQQILKVLHVLAWIFFIGMCIESGGFIFNTLFTLFINPEAAGQFWNGLDFSTLLQHNQSIFVLITVLMSIAAVLKTILLYRIVNISKGTTLNMEKPFNETLGRFMFSASYLSLAVGLFSLLGTGHVSSLVEDGVQMPTIEHLRLGGADVWIFMGVILFVIAQIFKRGIEIQTENELTV